MAAASPACSCQSTAGQEASLPDSALPKLQPSGGGSTGEKRDTGLSILLISVPGLCSPFAQSLLLSLRAAVAFCFPDYHIGGDWKQKG